jgi:membrane-bound lytic murein transglycosylase A
LALVAGLFGVPPRAGAEATRVAPPAGAAEACDDLELEPLASALTQTGGILSRRAGPPMRFGARSVSPAEYAARTLLPLVELAGAGDRGALCHALAARFDWYRVSPAGASELTGYFTPLVRGALARDETYRFPLYRRPPGAAGRATTAQILAGALAGRGLELVWLADPYDALALHVEGSGKVQLPDGRALPVGTDGNNGQPYTNLSQLLIADGKLAGGPAPPATQPGNPKARRYFAEHPGELDRYWARNPHYVFFRASDGPAGRLGPLTPGRSVAIDPAYVPLGALLVVRAHKPVAEAGRVVGWQPYTRIVLGQDTGAGIRGPRRVDVYFGDDEYAQVAAASASVKGDLYLLVARQEGVAVRPR